jgi:hypothetical protein
MRNVSMTPFHVLLANHSLSLQIGSPNKKARLHVHRAFVQSDQNNSQISLLLEAAGVYHNFNLYMVVGYKGE